MDGGVFPTRLWQRLSHHNRQRKRDHLYSPDCSTRWKPDGNAHSYLRNGLCRYCFGQDHGLWDYGFRLARHSHRAVKRYSAVFRGGLW